MTDDAVIRALEQERPDEPEAVRLGRLLDALPPGRPLSPKAIDILSHALRGGLGDEHQRLDRDRQAHVSFWRELSDRFPTVPRLRGIYGDTLLLTGDPGGARQQFLAAFTADPLLLYGFGGELRDLFQLAGGGEWAAYRALVIKAADIDDPVGNRDYVAEQQSALLADLRQEPDLVPGVLRILQGTGRPDASSEESP